MQYDRCRAECKKEMMRDQIVEKVNDHKVRKVINES